MLTLIRVISEIRGFYLLAWLMPRSALFTLSRVAASTLARSLCVSGRSSRAALPVFHP